MISAKEASEIIFSKKADWGTELVAIEKCYGRVLREDILADRDFPPFDRVTMDGITIQHDDFDDGVREFDIESIQTAGEPQKTLQNSGSAHEIMTGAILSKNADLVIRYEDLDIISIGEKKIARVNLTSVERWKNVHKKGTDRKKGDCLLKKGRVLSSSDVSILATVGKSKVVVSRHPKVAIISTGDELVEVNQHPESHQIRMSNSVMIQARLNEMNMVNERFHLLDDYDILKRKIQNILESFDILLVSGGVSKGKADYVPEVLEEIGVKKQFHCVAQRPGKPFWFGDKDGEKFVFALPGNPISTFMCFVVYFIPWLTDNLKSNKKGPQMAQLSKDHFFKPDLTYFLQVSCSVDYNGVLIADPIEGGGSGDLSNLAKSNAFLELPSNRQKFNRGEPLKVYAFRDS